MKKITCLFALISFCLVGLSQAQEPSKEFQKETEAIFDNGLSNFNKKPFKKSNTVALASVNLRFKIASRQEDPKESNNVTWAFLEGVDEALMQEIADAYYQLLAADLQEAGYTVSEDYKNAKNYKSLVDDNAKNERVTSKAMWGIAEIYTANGDTYIEFPNYAGGDHAKLAKETDAVVWQSLITIDFVEIAQRELSKKEYEEIKNSTELGRELRANNSRRITETKPVVRIMPQTLAQPTFKGDGTYARFSGPDFSGGGAFLNQEKAIYSQVPYQFELSKTDGIPAHVTRFKSAVLGDLAAIASGGAVKTGRGLNEVTFNVKTDAASFKAATLDALKQYNQYLLTYIKMNN
ncbi:hypothetical protein QWY31_13315 [Cytophagales bacterium LB-30]|uniref:Uncharacterized protein n=1 Tax=Shiella aurantiaca TaxID=3058365 RepID=A0ABT8F7L4_9BACT|nr:hypothetical protein [Shiella aurantiaca]MDN4166483.1 hypothetical protein [Shiella aurantiaca]